MITASTLASLTSASTDACWLIATPDLAESSFASESIRGPSKSKSAVTTAPSTCSVR